jgi:hypothetical protein
MTGWRGFLAGAVALAAFSSLVESATPAQLGGVFGQLTGFLARFLDPTVPALGKTAPSSSIAGALFQPFGPKATQQAPGPFGAGPAQQPGAVSG